MVLKFVCFLFIFFVFFFFSFSFIAQSQDNSTEKKMTPELNISCGNSICELGENSYNCPFDCSRLPFDYSTNFLNPSILAGQNDSYSISLINRINRSIELALSVDKPLKDYIILNKSNVELNPHERYEVPFTLVVPKDEKPRVVKGNFIVSYRQKKNHIALSLRIIEFKESLLELKVDSLTKTLGPDDKLSFFVELYSFDPDPVNLTLDYTIRDLVSGEVHYNDNRSVAGLESSLSFIEHINLSNSSELSAALEEGTYFIEASTDYSDEPISSSSEFSIYVPFWTPQRIRITSIISSIIFVLVSGIFIYKRYEAWKRSKMRYIMPAISKLPKKSENFFRVGKLPELNRWAYFDPRDLTTHCLVAGSTGSGKSVTASVIAEEALLHNIPVIAFDPTNQWTGFVKQLTDKRIMSFFKQFNLSEDDARSFKGLIYNVTSPDVDINIKRYMTPGEITVFNLSSLKPGEYDQAVMHIVDKIFTLQWPETHDMKVFLVFDEVHRLLEKYGGKGGYVALEKACREFRKWGLGILMVSQVSADFKQAVAGNILTEVQLNTKSIEDIEKIGQKYGTDFSSKITRQGIGVGLVQNPRYNDGKPWFIHFRPPLHNPHKIPEEELLQYSEYSEKLDKFEELLAKAKAAKKSVSDIELELKLTRDKLKEGHFKMVDIYIKSLEDNIRKL